MTEIYYTSISAQKHDQLMSKYLTEFSPAFSDRLLRYRRWEDAQLSMLGRLLLKHGLEKNNLSFSDRQLVFSSFNKPLLKDNSFQFNISHSGEVVVCAITDVAEVGIDIELIKPINLSDFKSQMTAKEWAEINSAKVKDLAFYDYWTQKEAALKAIGKGLSIPLNTFVINKDKTCEIEGNLVNLEEVNIKDRYVCHIAFMNQKYTQASKTEEIVF